MSSKSDELNESLLKGKKVSANAQDEFNSLSRDFISAMNEFMGGQDVAQHHTAVLAAPDRFGNWHIPFKLVLPAATLSGELLCKLIGPYGFLIDNSLSIRLCGDFQRSE